MGVLFPRIECCVNVFRNTKGNVTSDMPGDKIVVNLKIHFRPQNGFSGGVGDIHLNVLHNLPEKMNNKQ
jgi:hypothetical protein